MKHLNKSFLSIIVVMLCLAAACAPAQQETTEAPVENSQSSSDTTDVKKEVLAASFEEDGNTDNVEAESVEVDQNVSEESGSTYFPTDEWQNSTPEEQGLDSELILQMFQKIQDENIDIHSVLLVRNGHLVTEAYVDPYSREIKHPMYSVTKSITSMLTGIAMQEGYIKSVDQKVLDFFPDIAQDVTDEKLQNLTLEHLLTMSAGYNTRTIPQPWVLSEKDASFDTIKHILTYNTILEKPGTTFYYDSGAPHVLSAIIQETTGMTTQAYAQEKLFNPLGISNITWQADPRGIPLGCTGLELSPRDMAKLGYLYLNDGQWNGEQIVPAEWVKKSTTQHIETKGLMNEAEDDGYGYYWWMDAYGGYSAHGYGGQYIFVIPNLDLVAVFTSGLANPDFPTPRKLMEAFILPAVTSTDPLPPSSVGDDLQTHIEKIANPAAQPVSPLPAIAQQISDKTFQITESSDPNIPYIETVTLTFEDGNTYHSKARWADGHVYEVTGGLDNRFVITKNAGDQGLTVALKGYWQDEKTFVETLKAFSQIDTLTHQYTFDGDKVTVDVNSSMGYSLQMKGEMVETTEADSAAESTRVAETDGMVQVYVPAGDFTMGDTDADAVADCEQYNPDYCTPGSFISSEPPHTVSLDAFWMDQTEVTNGMYALCVDDGACQPPSQTNSWTHDEYFGNSEFDSYPVIYVSWDDARTYCEWAGRRLPTEAEWEKAARGTDARMYPWGNEPVSGQRANFADKNFPYSNGDPEQDDGYKDVAPAGSYPTGASPYGALDMVGNVHEWTSSLYKPYPYQADDGREAVDAPGDRATRGNACDAAAYQMRTGYRSAMSPDYRGDYLGFRCAGLP